MSFWPNWASTFITLVRSQRMQKTTTPKRRQFQWAKKKTRSESHVILRSTSSSHFFSRWLSSSSSSVVDQKLCDERKKWDYCFWVRGICCRQRCHRVKGKTIILLCKSVRTRLHSQSASQQQQQWFQLCVCFCAWRKAKSVEMTNIDRARVICLKCNVCRDVPRFQLD